MKVKKRYSHRDLLEIPIDIEPGLFAYGKYIDYRKNGYDGSCYQVMVVFNCFSKEPIDDIELIVMEGYFCNHIMFFGNHNVPAGWRVLGKVAEENDDFPCLGLRNHLPEILKTEEDVFNAKWFYALQSDTTDLSTLCEYDEVRHLELTSVLYLLSIPVRLRVEYLKSKRQDIKSFYENRDTRSIYLDCFDIPIYENIPVEFRMKRCPGGISNFILKP